MGADRERVQQFRRATTGRRCARIEMDRSAHAGHRGLPTVLKPFWVIVHGMHRMGRARSGSGWRYTHGKSAGNSRCEARFALKYHISMGVNTGCCFFCDGGIRAGMSFQRWVAVC